MFESNTANNRRNQNEDEHIAAMVYREGVCPIFALLANLQFVSFPLCHPIALQYHSDPQNNLDKCAANGMDYCLLIPNNRVIWDEIPSQEPTNDRGLDYLAGERRCCKFVL